MLHNKIQYKRRNYMYDHNHAIELGYINPRKDSTIGPLFSMIVVIIALIPFLSFA